MNKTITISSRQIKAARALLNWSQDNLAEASELSIATIRKIESGNTSPRGKTNKQIRNSLEKVGLEFWEPGGVRYRPEEIRVFEGIEGAKEFYEDIYQTLSKNGGEALVLTPDSTRVLRSDPFKDFAHMHSKRMAKIKTISKVKCIQTDNHEQLAAPEYCEYRFLSPSATGPIWYYIHGDKVSFRIFRDNIFPKAIVITSKELSEQFREHFYALWNQAIPISTIGKDKS